MFVDGNPKYSNVIVSMNNIHGNTSHQLFYNFKLWENLIDVAEFNWNQVEVNKEKLAQTDALNSSFIFNSIQFNFIYIAP